ncbi:MAG: DinB family protein [Dehalococcoidia bacterium]
MHNRFVTAAMGANTRDREAEFRAEARDLGDLRARAEQVLAAVRAVLEPMSTADLDAPCDLSGFDEVTQRYFGPDITCRGMILHVAKHLGEHAGHVGLTLQLWRAATGATA